LRRLRFLLACFVSAALLVSAGCRAEETGEENIVFTGTVKEAAKGMIVVEEIGEKETMGFDIAAVHYDESATSVVFEIGQKVRVTALPDVAESYPVQVTGVKIEILEERSAAQESPEPEPAPAPTLEAGIAYTAPYFRADGYAHGGLDYLLGRAVNAEKMAISSVQHLPALVFSDAASFAAFVDEGADYFQWDSTYGAQEAFSETIAKYDDSFFADHDIVLLYAQETSGSNRHEIQQAVIEGQTLCVTVRRIRPEVGTDDMADWFILLEFAKDDIAGVSGWDAVITEE